MTLSLQILQKRLTLWDLISTPRTPHTKLKQEEFQYIPVPTVQPFPQSSHKVLRGVLRAENATLITEADGKISID